jgi:hypothetical protein
VKCVVLLFLAAAAPGGEALSNVVVQFVGRAWRATSDSTGRFRISEITAGDYVLNVSTVGYHLVKKSFHFVLRPETFRQRDSVEVQASPFEASRRIARPPLCSGLKPLQR